MFDFLSEIFKILLYQPLFNALVLLYEALPGGDFGIAVIVLTLGIKVLFYPLGAQGLKSQKQLQDLQPKLKAIQEQLKGDREKQTVATMELYKREGVNPFSGCLPLLIQLPIFLALFQIFRQGLGPQGLNPQQISLLYSFVPHPEVVNTVFMGIIDLAKPSIPFAIITGVSQLIQAKMSGPRIKPHQKTEQDLAQIMQTQMTYFFPAFTVIILLGLPAAMSLYWLVATLFTILQQYFIFKKQTAPL